MSSVLDRTGLEKSPLADLHVLASELGVENFRRLRKADLIDALLDRQGGADTGTDEAGTDEADTDVDVDVDVEETPEAEEKPRPRRGRRGGRSRARRDEDDGGDAEEAEEAEEKPRGRSRDRDRNGGRNGGRDGDSDGGEDKIAEGVVELLANGSGFVRLAPPEPTDDDVYISAAQVKRCELVSGDRVGGR